MIKKGLYLLLSYIVIISVLSSCSSSNKTTYPPTARDVVNTILRKLTEGDIANILKYCDEDSAQALQLPLKIRSFIEIVIISKTGFRYLQKYV